MTGYAKRVDPVPPVALRQFLPVGATGEQLWERLKDQRLTRRAGFGPWRRVGRSAITSAPLPTDQGVCGLDFSYLRDFLEVLLAASGVHHGRAFLPHRLTIRELSRLHKRQSSLPERVPQPQPWQAFSAGDGACRNPYFRPRRYRTQRAVGAAGGTLLGCATAVLCYSP